MLDNREKKWIQIYKYTFGEKNEKTHVVIKFNGILFISLRIVFNKIMLFKTETKLQSIDFEIRSQAVVYPLFFAGYRKLMQ